jgi:DNA/RNA-binding domain of Phe-tRNA-synthetase-like protein
VQPLRISWKSSNTTALLGLLRSVDVRVGTAPLPLVEELRQRVVARPLNATVRDAAIRAMLRKGGFRPSGRNRPAQEYLGNVAASSAGLQSICNIVDVNNTFSLKHRLPASIFDVDCVGQELIVREGRPGERYVFNASGQALRLKGLLCLCAGDGSAIASPVKDAFAAHVTEKTTAVIAGVYGSREILSSRAMAELVEEYAALITKHANAKITDMVIASSEGIQYHVETSVNSDT